MKRRAHLLLLLALAVSMASCRGHEICAQLSDPLDDIDGDCIENEEDLCPYVSSNYFGTSLDTDEDGLGLECDENDWIETCGVMDENTDGDCEIFMEEFYGDNIYSCGDCIHPVIDNCDTATNAAQTDEDEDGVGCVCDTDDGNAGITTERDPANYDYECDVPEASARVAAVKTLAQQTFGYVNPGIATATTPAPTLDWRACRYSLKSCSDSFIGNLNGDVSDTQSVADKNGEYGNPNSQNSILNPLGFYGRSFTSCSAFNDEAKYPPAVYCRNGDADTLAGYLTTNPLIANRVDACAVIAALGLKHPECE